MRIRAELTGPGVELGLIPAADIAKLILGMQKALAAAAATVARQERKGVTGRYPQAIEAASRLRFVGVERGSVASLFTLPEAESRGDADLGFEVQHLAEIAFAKLLESISAPEHQVDWGIARSVANLCEDLRIGERNTALRLGYDDRTSRAGMITGDVRSRMTSIARRPPTSQPDHVSGVLVEADFERNSARLQPTAGPPIAVSFSADKADEIQEALRGPADVIGEVTLDPVTHTASKVTARALFRAEQLAMESGNTIPFWEHWTVADLAARQGISAPQDIGNLHSELEFTEDEIAAYFAGADE